MKYTILSKTTAAFAIAAALLSFSENAQASPTRIPPSPTPILKHLPPTPVIPGELHRAEVTSFINTEGTRVILRQFLDNVEWDMTSYDNESPDYDGKFLALVRIETLRKASELCLISPHPITQVYISSNLGGLPTSQPCL